MRILFASSDPIALPTLEALHREGLLGGVLTAPPAPAGRGRRSTPNPIDRHARERGVPVLTPSRLGAEARSEALQLRCDLLVCFAYGRIFGPKFLGLFPQGGVNLHPSLLPRHRGPSPAPFAILAGDPETGLTLQTLALEVDSGDILAQVRWPLSPQDTAASILSRAAAEAPSLLLRALSHWDQTLAGRQAQDPSLVTQTRLLTKDDGRLDWHQNAVELDRRIRAFNPWPGAFTHLDGMRLLLWDSRADPEASVEGPPGQILGLDKERGLRVQTARGHVLLLTLQWEGRRPVDHLAFWNGHRHLLGRVFEGP